MTGYALHPEAFADVDEIRVYIAEENPDAADRLITEIFDGIRALVSFPNQGYRRTDLTSRVAVQAGARVLDRVRSGQTAIMGSCRIPRA